MGKIKTGTIVGKCRKCGLDIANFDRGKCPRCETTGQPTVAAKCKIWEDVRCDGKCDWLHVLAEIENGD